MKTLMESILQGYGSLVTVREGESARTFRALVQPVTEKGWQATRKVIETLGKIQKGQYVYIGPADVELRAGQRLEVQGEKFLVRRCETRYLADEAVYSEPSKWACGIFAGGRAQVWDAGGACALGRARGAGRAQTLALRASGGGDTAL